MSIAFFSPRFRYEIGRTLRLSAPLAAGHLSQGLVGLINAMVAGHHNTTTLAAISVGSALFWLPMLAPMGVLMALPPSVSQMDGAGRHADIGPLFRQSLWLALALGIVLFIIALIVGMIAGVGAIAGGGSGAATGFAVVLSSLISIPIAYAYVGVPAGIYRALGGGNAGDVFA